MSVRPTNADWQPFRSSEGHHLCGVVYTKRFSGRIPRNYAAARLMCAGAKGAAAPQVTPR